jgi:hypothetical protein
MRPAVAVLRDPALAIEEEAGVSTRTATRHPLLRPSWTCGDDGEPWPCLARRDQFLSDYARDRQKLYNLMWAFYIEASGEAVVPIVELHTRFIAWTIRV